MSTLRELQPGTTLQDGRYLIEEKISSGGFGITYKAVQRGLNKTVCIKEFFIDGNCVRNTAACTVHLQGMDDKTFEKFRQRFVEEAQLLSKLKHTNIVEVLEVFSENNTSYIVMSFIEGITLKKLIKDHGPLDYEQTVNYLGQVSEALGYIHQLNPAVLHRDVKPDNIIITPEFHAILIDFGSAREFKHDKTQMHTAMVTPGYAPPEQYNALSKKGSYTDIYSLGAVYYYTLTGEEPLESAVRHIETMLLPKEIKPEISEDVNRTIMKAMALKPENRHQTIAEFMDDLFGTSPSAPIKDDLPKKTPKALIISLIIVFVALMAGGGFLWKNQTDRTEAKRQFNEMINGHVDNMEVRIRDGLIYLRPPENLPLAIYPNKLHETLFYVTDKELQGEWIEASDEIINHIDNDYLYSGQMKNGAPHGEGVAEYINGDKYAGTFHKGLRQGKGKRTYADGVIYEGDYLNDKAHGRGIMTWIDKSFYNGAWENDMQHGFGRFTTKDGIEISGVYENGKMVERR